MHQSGIGIRTFVVTSVRSFSQASSLPGNIFANFLRLHRAIVPHNFSFFPLPFPKGNLYPYLVPVFFLEVLPEVQSFSKGELVVAEPVRLKY